ncbi:MAG: PASTA domain-containing protein [Candidatus Azobacteroides pseudotrichonymphae]|jgi:beta-lactam-binding protein with PASTA domain|nr:PASTA domain-containing protein [Bacteroidales bacterium OttesenSCG-928-I14]GMO35658.1 MAG: PASTA domain-containing protein [Candidatus Azobacteroides pseudotrichonymphae]
MRFFSNTYVKHGLLTIAALLFIIFFLTKGLDNYTRHGQQVEIPDVKGWQVKEIEEIFKQKKLHYIIADSLFIKDNIPGSVLKTVPPIGTNVKPGRTIALIINSYNDVLLSVPTVQDMSRRQAQSLLQSVGYKYVQTKIVSGPYKDLVIGLENERGDKLNPGDCIAANTHLFILVSSGTKEILSLDTTVVVDNEPEESWY